MNEPIEATRVAAKESERERERERRCTTGETGNQRETVAAAAKKGDTIRGRKESEVSAFLTDLPACVMQARMRREGE